MAATDSFLSRCLAKIKDFAMDTYEEVRWSNAKLLELIDEANSDVWEILSREAEPKTSFNFCSTSFSIVANQSDYTFPGNFRKFIRLVKRNTITNVVENEIFPVQDLSDLSGMIIYDSNRGFRLFPTPTAAETGWTLEYEAGPIPMLHASSSNSTGGTTTEMIVAAAKISSPDYGSIVTTPNYYAGSYIRFLTGTLFGKIVRVTAYSVSTNATFFYTPATDTIPNSCSYEILPCLPYPDDSVIAWRVVMWLKAADSDSGAYKAAEMEFQNGLRRVLSKVGNIQKRQGPSVADAFIDSMDFGDVF